MASTLTVTGASANSKIYDGTNLATVNFSAASLNGVAPADMGSVFLVTNGYTATFSDKNVGTGKTVSVANLTLTGPAASGYTLTQPTLSANITPLNLAITASGINKTYDATTNASVNLSDNSLPGDDVVDFYDTAGYADKNVGTNKTVIAYDLYILGTDSGNYNLTNATAATTANISSKVLRVGATGQNKPYDGTTNATVTLLDNHLTGDSISDSYASASFADQYVGSGKTITVTGISIGGADAPNYALTTTTATARANITPRPLNVTATGVNKPYDGNTNATVSLGDDRISGDNITVNFSSASFSDKNVGSGKTVTVYALVITGPDSSSYTPASNNIACTANITSRTLTVVATGVNKTYDGTTNATVTLADNRVTGDNLTNQYTAASFGDKNVGSGKTVSVTGISLTGPDAINYTLGNTTATTPANITAASLTVGATGVNKTYDGTTNASVTLTDNRVAGDNLTETYSGASFTSPGAGTGKTVNVTGITVTGPDSGNYTLTGTTASTTANITARTLNVAATGVNKVYDGTTNASVTLSDNRLTGDILTVGDTGVGFTDKAVGSGKTVNVSGINVTGPSASNYTLASTTTTATAAITPLTLVVTATGVNKVYDGTTTATVTLSDNRIAGDIFTDSYGSASFTTATVGTGKTVNVASIFISGTDAGNYSLSNTTAVTTANITPAGTSASFTSSENPSGFLDAIAFTDTLPSGATGTVTVYTNGVAFNSGALSGGAYTSGSLTNLARGTNTITAVYSGDINYAGVTNTLAQVVTNHPPVTGFFTFATTNGVALKLKISTLLTAVADADGDPITLTGVGVTTNGVVLATNSTYILYHNSNLVNDQFSYTVSDGHGGSATGQVSVVSVVAPFTGQNISLTPTGATNFLTFHAIPTFTYIIERSVNLLTWVDISTNSAASNGVISYADNFADLGGPPSSAFYRLKWVP